MFHVERKKLVIFRARGRVGVEKSLFLFLFAQRYGIKAALHFGHPGSIAVGLRA